MWVSEKLRGSRRADETGADLGVTTIGGSRAGVYARGEVREVRVCTPGGICWQPRSGDRVVVLRGGPGGEERFVLGVQDEEGADLADGELYFHAGSASIRLRNNGAIELTGQVFINGTPYQPCLCAATET